MKFFGRSKDKTPVRRRLADRESELTAIRTPHENSQSTEVFTRGRALSGVNLHEHAARESERKKIKELRTRRRRIGTVLIILLVVVAAGLILLSQFSGSFGRVTSSVPTVRPVDAARYEKIANDYFASKPIERFRFAIRTKDFNTFLTNAAPEVKSAEVTSGSFLISDLSLTLRKPIAKWETDGQTYYVDDEGVIFNVNYFAEPTIAIHDESGAAAEQGGAVTSRRFLRFVGQVISGVDSSGVGKVDRVIIPPGSVRYIEFYIAGRNYPFKAQIDRDAASQTSDIVNMIKYLDSRSIVPSYVDVRVVGKGYWK